MGSQFILPDIEDRTSEDDVIAPIGELRSDGKAPLGDTGSAMVKRNNSKQG